MLCSTVCGVWLNSLDWQEHLTGLATDRYALFKGYEQSGKTLDSTGQTAPLTGVSKERRTA
jgi:hypothetical protein